MFCGARDVESTRVLNPELQTFDEWLAVNKGRIPLESKLEPNPAAADRPLARPAAELRR